MRHLRDQEESADLRESDIVEEFQILSFSWLLSDFCLTIFFNTRILWKQDYTKFTLVPAFSKFLALLT